MQNELLSLRRAHLEISHQLENANEEVRALSLRLQENVSIKTWSFKNLRNSVNFCNSVNGDQKTMFNVKQN